jgi:hypothetical protein
MARSKTILLQIYEIQVFAKLTYVHPAIAINKTRQGRAHRRAFLLEFCIPKKPHTRTKLTLLSQKSRGRCIISRKNTKNKRQMLNFTDHREPDALFRKKTRNIKRPMDNFTKKKRQIHNFTKNRGADALFHVKIWKT